MRTLITILTLILLTSFQCKQEKSIRDFAQTQLDLYKIISVDKSEYFTYSLERLKLHDNKMEVAIKAKKSHSNKNSYNRTVYTRIQLRQFQFETKEICRQAIDSLLNCFPNDCFKIKRQIDQGIKFTPSIWIFSEKSIYIAKTNCEHIDEKWIKFKKEFTNLFAKANSEIIVTECGKLKWTTKEKVMQN